MTSYESKINRKSLKPLFRSLGELFTGPIFARCHRKRLP